MLAASQPLSIPKHSVRPFTMISGESEQKPFMSTFFSDFFAVDHDSLDRFGSFDVSLINDLPLFIDRFVLFLSVKPEYQAFHDSIIRYLRFIRDRSVSRPVNDVLLRSWYCFPEI